MNWDQVTHKKQVEIRMASHPSRVKRYQCIHAIIVNSVEYTCPPMMCIQSIMCDIDQADGQLISAKTILTKIFTRYIH